MNFKNILQELEQADNKANDTSDRRNLLKQIGPKLAMAAIPFGISSLFSNKAAAKTTATGSAPAVIVTAINYILELEYFQYNLHHTALATGSNATSTLIPPADRPGFQMIEGHQLAHLKFLRKTIDNWGAVPFTPNGYTGNALTGNPYSPPSYDFTANLKYRVFENYDRFLELAQTIEDMMVRAYQGQLGELMANPDDILTSVMTMNSVEARHAAYIRNVRRDRGAVDVPKPWITQNAAPTIQFIEFYLQEDNYIQKGYDVTALSTSEQVIPTPAATEAFDEPLTKATVRALIQPFLL